MGCFATQRRGCRVHPATTKPMDCLYSNPKVDYFGSILNNTWQVTLRLYRSCPCILQLDARHEQSQFFRGGVLTADNIHNPALINDCDTI